MRNNLNKFLLCAFIALNIGGVILVKQKKESETPIAAPVIPVSPTIPEIKEPRKAQISNLTPSYQNYGQVVAQIKEWHSEAIDLTEVGIYGKTSRGKDIYYIRVNNKLDTSFKPVVLITASIHGNEPWSTSTSMWYISHLLNGYGENEEITNLINTRDIYYVPVVSPDTYPSSRHVDGVDPNRDFPTLNRPNHISVPPVRALREFFLTIKPNAVISGHTYGRVILYPWGDSMQLCPDHNSFSTIIGQFASLCSYRNIRACQMYNEPIYGSEVDWYYRNGAFKTLPNGRMIHRGTFAIVCEFGTHQRIPTMQEIRTEFDRTYKAFLYFLKEAPLVEIWWDENGNAVNSDGSQKMSWVLREAA